MGLPVKSMGRACGCERACSWPSGPTRTIRSRSTIPQHIIPERRFASLLVRDRDLAKNLAAGFEGLWRKAMRSLQEIHFDPRGSKSERS
jgi:hypothetical protein